MIISICKGGLGNRLKSLSSCYAIAKKTGRMLGIVWETDLRCDAGFSYLFSNEIICSSLDWILSKNNISLYTNADWVKQYYPNLFPIVKKYGCINLDKTSKIINDNNDLIVVYSNDYLNGCTAKECKAFFDWLTPINVIEEKLQKLQKHLQLDKTFVGVHARGTDYECGGVTVKTYLERMDAEYKKNKNVKFFVCSDSLEYETIIKNSFPQVYINKKENYVFKANNDSDWRNNVQRPLESVQDALVDMYLLSKTNFKIYHPNSTFAHIVNMMSLGVLQRNPVEKRQSKYYKYFRTIKKIVKNWGCKKNV